MTEGRHSSKVLSKKFLEKVLEVFDNAMISFTNRVPDQRVGDILEIADSNWKKARPDRGHIRTSFHVEDKPEQFEALVELFRDKGIKDVSIDMKLPSPISGAERTSVAEIFLQRPSEFRMIIADHLIEKYPEASVTIIKERQAAKRAKLTASLSKP